MGRSPPPPPPPARQPYKWEKEESMKNRNESFAYAIEASRSSYTAAVVVKTLADRLLPITEERLRTEINEHYRIVTEYQKASILYNATANTFLYVDSIIASSLNKIDAIRDIGEVNIDYLDTHFKTLLQHYNTMLSHEASINNTYTDASAVINQIKKTFDSGNYSGMNAIINAIPNKITTFASDSRSKLAEATATKNLIDTLMTTNPNPSSGAEASRSSASSMVDKVIQTLQGVTDRVVKTYNTDISKLQKELERLKKWQVVYKARADEVRNRDNIILNGDVFLQLLYWARNAHANAIYAAMYAFSANRYAYQDVHNVP